MTVATRDFVIEALAPYLANVEAFLFDVALEPETAEVRISALEELLELGTEVKLHPAYLRMVRRVIRDLQKIERSYRAD